MIKNKEYLDNLIRGHIEDYNDIDKAINDIGHSRDVFKTIGLEYSSLKDVGILVMYIKEKYYEK